MSVTEQDPISISVANGATTFFNYGFYAAQAADLVVQFDGVQKTLNVDYLVSVVGQQSGGTIVTTTPPANGVVVTIYRDTKLERPGDFQNAGDFSAGNVNLEYDRIWLAIQELASGGKGSQTALRVPSGETVSPFPAAALRANRLVGFDSAGNPIGIIPTPGDASALALDLLSTATGSKGAGQVGFNESLTYPAGTVGEKLKNGVNIAIENIAALRLRTDTTGVALQVKGYYTAGDGGGGIYWSDPTDVSSTDNGGTIIVASNGMRWKLFRTTAVNVKQFGAKGDDLTDDTAAIQAAITAVGPRELYWLRGTYRHSATLNMPVNQAWKGPGGQRAVILKRMFIGDSVTVTDTNSIRDIDIDGNAASYAGGRGIYIGAGVSHLIERVRVHDTWDEALEFANNVAPGSQVVASEFGVTTISSRNLTIGAIKLRDSTACPRFFSGIWLSGGLLDVKSGGNGSTFQCFYIGNIATDASTALFHMNSGRVASLAASTILQGTDVQISNVAFSGTVFVQNAQGYQLTNNTYGAGIFITDANSRYNYYQEQGRSYTPAWSQSSGTQPVLNDGTLTGFLTRNGYTATVQFELVAGASTTFGNNATPYRITLPFQGHIAFNQAHIPVQVYDASTQTHYTVWGAIGAGEDFMTFGYGNGSVQSTSPMTFASGDKISAHFTYLTK